MTTHGRKRQEEHNFKASLLHILSSQTLDSTGLWMEKTRAKGVTEAVSVVFFVISLYVVVHAFSPRTQEAEAGSP